MIPTKIDNPQDIRIYKQDYVSHATVFLHDENCEWQNVTNKLEWHSDWFEGDEFIWLHLDEIAEQLSEVKVIMVMVEDPLNGVIYEYGNHGDYWEEVGKLCGYA